MYNHKIETSFLARAFGTLGLKARKAVYNTMREITMIQFGIGIKIPTEILKIKLRYMMITLLKDLISTDYN